MPKPEALAREAIDEALRLAGWLIQDVKDANVDAGVEALKRVHANLKRYRVSVLKAACEGRLVPTEAELARTERRDYEPASKLLERILERRRAKWEASQSKKLPAIQARSSAHSWKSKHKEPSGPDVPALAKLPPGWVWASLDQLAIRMRNGVSTKPDQDDGVPILRISAVHARSVDTSAIRFLSGHAADFEDYLVNVGDLLFTRYNGTTELVGVCGMVRHLSGPLAHPDKLIRVVLVNGCHPAFVEAVVNTGPSRDYLAKRIERRLSVITKVEMLIDVQLRRAKHARWSILKRAFEGTLVPQDPKDEPASVLLERIRQQRGSPLPVALPPGQMALAFDKPKKSRLPRRRSSSP